MVQDLNKKVSKNTI